MPLAHILAPQLIRKAQEIEDAIGPPRPLAGAGYLQAKSEPKSFDGSSTEGQALVMAGRMQRSGDPAQEAFARGMLKDKKNPTAFLPTAPQTREPAPANAPRTPPTKKGEKRVIALPPGAVGVSERGESVNARGGKLGYLGTPAIVTPYGETPMRTGGRRNRDVGPGDQDKFSNDVYARDYGHHLKAMQENRDPQGLPTDKFPEGYFDGKTAAQKKDIIDGVKELRRREKLAEQGTPI